MLEPTRPKLALVADVVARLTAPGFRESGLTIGVITFNAEQQKLIEDLLDDARRKDPRLDVPLNLAEDELEPLFVTNPESGRATSGSHLFLHHLRPDPAGQLADELRPAQPPRRRAPAQRGHHSCTSRTARLRQLSSRAGLGARRPSVCAISNTSWHSPNAVPVRWRKPTAAAWAASKAP